MSGNNITERQKGFFERMNEAQIPGVLAGALAMSLVAFRSCVLHQEYMDQRLSISVPEKLRESGTDLSNPAEVAARMGIVLNGDPNQKLFDMTVEYKGDSKPTIFAVDDCRKLGLMMQDIKEFIAAPPQPPSSIPWAERRRRDGNTDEQDKAR